MYNMAKKRRKMKGRMEKGLISCRFATTETKHTYENKVCIQNGNVLASP
jgi:hypothetical protein